MSVEDMDKNVLATLTDEERAALESSEHSEEDIGALRNIAGEDDGADGDGDEGGDDDGEGAAAPVEGTGTGAEAGNKGDEDQGAAPVADTEGEAGDDAEDEAFLPTYQATLPEDYNDRVKALDESYKALAQQLKDGEIEVDDYHVKVADLNGVRDELATIRAKAEISQEMSAQYAQQEWRFNVDRFMRRAAKDGGIDYRQDEAKRNDLDFFVKVLAKDEQYRDKDYQWFLAEAHKRVKALHGIGEPAPQGQDGNKGNDKPASRKPPTGALPKTLAHVPGGDGPGDVAGEFSNLDGLEGFELEDAIARMTPAQRERWKNAA